MVWARGKRGVAVALLGLGAAAMGSAGLGCAVPAKRASMQTLYARATYDLGCPGNQVRVFSIDGRTKALVGCTRRLVYIEHCDPALGADACSWVLDTPTFSQAQWPQQEQALADQRRQWMHARGAPPPEWRWRPRRQRTFTNDLGVSQPPAAPSKRVAKAVEPTPPKATPQRAKPKRLDAQGRPFRSELFDGDGKRSDEQRREDALGF